MNDELQISNKTKSDVKSLEDLVRHLFRYIQNSLKLQELPQIQFVSDLNNAKNPLGQTAFYEPKKKCISVFIDNRHIKDVLRSIAHEAIHFYQDLRGDLQDASVSTEAGYAQQNGHLRKMEEEAYLKGNMIFRDWEDKHKSNNKSLQESFDKDKGFQKSILPAQDFFNEKDLLMFAQKAINSGADSRTIRYFNGGAEGVIYTDQSNKLFKVGRSKSLENEAKACNVLFKHGLSPKLFHYNPKTNVLVREKVNGHVGRWADQKKVWVVYEKIVDILKQNGFTKPEFKEDSFVIDGDDVKMVDIGFTGLRDDRLAKSLAKIDFSKTDGWSDAMDSQLGITNAFEDGSISLEQAQSFMNQIVNKEQREHGLEMLDMKNQHKSKQRLKETKFSRKDELKPTEPYFRDLKESKIATYKNTRSTTQDMSTKIENFDSHKLFVKHRQNSMIGLMEKWGYVNKSGQTFLNESWGSEYYIDQERQKNKEEDEKEREQRHADALNKRDANLLAKDKKTGFGGVPSERAAWAARQKESLEEDTLPPECKKCGKFKAQCECETETIDENVSPMNQTDYTGSTHQRTIKGKEDCSCPDKIKSKPTDEKKKLDEVINRVIVRLVNEMKRKKV